MQTSNVPIFSLDVQPQRGRVVIAVAGELDCATAPRVAAALRELRAAGWSDVALDVTRVGFVDSTGLATLLDAQRCARADGWSVAIDGPCAPLERLLDLTGLRGLVAIT